MFSNETTFILVGLAFIAGLIWFRYWWPRHLTKKALEEEAWSKMTKQWTSGVVDHCEKRYL